MTLPTRLVQTVDGELIVTTFGPDVDVLAAMEIRGFTFIGFPKSKALRTELREAPKFKGINGPMWDGDAIRYECPDSYAALSA